MRITFSPGKHASNREKHGASLALGAEVLADADRPDIRDVRFAHVEERFVADGMVEKRGWV